MEVLWALSGRRFGPCPVTVRPCVGGGCPDPCGYPPGVAFWVNVSCGCGYRCGGGCGPRYEISLPGPVHAVTEVKIDGAVLVSSAYRVSNRRSLIRQDGGVWPPTQAYQLPDGQPNTWSVSYLRGDPVPAAGNYAAGTLAVEIAKACQGSKCKLPQRVQSISRQGVELALLDPMDFLDEGRTGLPDVDQWLAAVNPQKHQYRPRVYSPDLSRFR